jgi:hypothetical protein
VSAIGGDVAARHSDCRSRLRERHDRATLQQPDQSDAVVTTQPLVSRVGVGRDIVKSEQVAGGPTQGLGLLPPLGQEAATVLNDTLLASGIDVVGTTFA